LVKSRGSRGGYTQITGFHPGLIKKMVEQCEKRGNGKNKNPRGKPIEPKRRQGSWDTLKEFDAHHASRTKGGGRLPDGRELRRVLV